VWVVTPNIKGAINLRKFTSLKQLAAILKLDKSGLRRYIKGLGIKGELRRMPDSRDQLTLSYKVEEVKAILQARQALGHTAAFPDFE